MIEALQWFIPVLLTDGCSSKQVRKSFEWLDVFIEWVSKLLKRLDVFTKWMSKSFKWLDVSTKRVIKPFEQMQRIFERITQVVRMDANFFHTASKQNSI